MRNFQKMAEDCGYACRSYSGRGMYGESCLAVTLERDQTIGQFISAVLLNLDNTDELADIAMTIEEMRMDSMGLGTVLYFPGYKYVEG